MTLDEAIAHCLEVAEQEECFINYPHSDIVLGDLDIESRKCFIAEQRQLAEWLKELKEAKRLLKVAMEDMKILYETGTDEGCIGIKFKWRYADEALKIIGG